MPVEILQRGERQLAELAELTDASCRAHFRAGLERHDLFQSVRPLVSVGVDLNAFALQKLALFDTNIAEREVGHNGAGEYRECRVAESIRMATF